MKKCSEKVVFHYPMQDVLDLVSKVLLISCSTRSVKLLAVLSESTVVVVITVEPL